MTVITRFAPSPTGYLHIGSLRTVLYNYLFAKQKNGEFMLRVEDTDRTRLVDGSIENMIKVLTLVGLTPDEGPNNPGKKGPYYQSERLDIYKKYIDELIKNDKAYYCFCSSERLTELREEQASLGLATKYDKKCRYLTQEEIKEKLDSGTPFTVRLKVPENVKVVFYDTIKGKIEVDSKDIDEQVLFKSDGFPTYHLASVVDDHLMGVTHIIRGDEWTPSAPKHVLLHEAFGWEVPNFSHIPLLLGKDGKKLSKRTGDVSVEVYLEKGYLVEALLNYIALLGWNPKTTEEFFTLDQLIEKFSLKNVHKAGAIFDVERLDFFNSRYIKNYDIKELFSLLISYLKDYNPDFLKVLSQYPEEYNLKILQELQTRMKRFDEYESLTTFFYNDIKKVAFQEMLNEKMMIHDIDIVKKGLEVTLLVLKIKGSDFASVGEVKDIFVEKIKEAGMKNGQVLWPTRYALSGEVFSPGALEMIYILGVSESIKRIEKIL